MSEPWPGYAVMHALQTAAETSTDPYDGSIGWSSVESALKEAGWEVRQLVEHRIGPDNGCGCAYCTRIREAASPS